MPARPVHERYAHLPWLIATMTVVALAIGMVAARYVETRLVASKGESLALAAAEIAHKLDLLLIEQYDDVQELSRTQIFRNGDRDAQSAHLATVKSVHPIYLWIGVTDGRGRITAATHPGSVGRDQGRSPWFQAARDTGSVHVGDVEPFEEAGGIDAVSFTAPIKGLGGEFRGTVTTRIGLPALEEVAAYTIRAFQAREEFGETLEYKFVTAGGNVFIDSDLLHKGNANLKRIGLPSALLGESGRPGYVEEDHLQRHVSVITGYALTRGSGEFPGLRWTVLLRSDKNDLVAPIRSMLWKLGAAWVLVWLPMFLFVLWSTSRLKKERALAQVEHAHAVTAEASYRQLVEQARDIIYRTDAQGRFTFINPVVTRLMGYTPEELLGRRFIELIRPDARDAAERFYGRQFVRKTLNTYYEFPAVTKDSREIWFGQNVQVIVNDGQVLGFHAVTRDITERKRAEEALRESERRFALVLEATSEGVWDWNIKTGAVYYSPHWIESLGYMPEDVPPHVSFWESIVHPDDMPRVREALRAHFEGRAAAYSCENRLRRKDGSWRWNLDRGKVVEWDADGKPLRMVGTDTDITERKRAEEAIRQEKEFSEGIITSSVDGILAFDRDCRYTVWNPGMERISGISKERTLGKCAFDVFPFLKDIGEDKYFFETLAGKTVVAKDRPYVVPETGRQGFFEGYYSPLFGKSGDIVGGLAIIRDITERKRAEEHQLRLLAEVAQAKERFETIFRTTPAAVGISTVQEGRLINVNDAFIRLTGYSREELIGRTTLELGLWADPSERPQIIRKILEQGSLQNGEGLLRTKTGEIRNLSVSVERIQVGPAPCLIYIAHDITERKQREEDQRRLLAELAESRNRFEMFFRQAPSAISITTLEEGRFLDVNKQAEVLTGYSRDELIGRTTTELNLYVDPADRTRLVAQLKEKGVLTDLEREIRTKSGEIRTAVFSLVPIQAGPKPCILSIAHDITERKRAESFLEGEKRVLEAISSGAPLPTVLESIARAVEEQRPGMLCSILLLDKSRKTLHHGAAPSLPPAYIHAVDGVAVGPAVGSCGTAAFREKTVIVTDIASDPLWEKYRSLALPHGLRACWSAPIFSSDRLVLGTFAQYYRVPKSPTAEDLHLVERFCYLAGIAIERADAEEVLRNANQALRSLSRQLLQVQEDDRRAIARDLHDEIGQSLTAIKLNVERAQRTAGQAARDRIMKDCLHITDGVLDQVRNLSLDLHPSILDDLGLAYALKWYADRQAERAGLKIHVAADHSLPRLSHDIETACFRIAQEALTNVVRHAKARRATVTLKQEPTRVELRVQDDGTGFVVNGTSPLDGEASVGLASMQERARLLGGEVRISSRLGHGTEVIAVLPLPLTASAETPATEASRS
jgi:PAS domain S-box-containing protein